MLPLTVIKAPSAKPFYRVLGITVVIGSFCAFGWVLADALRSAEGLKPDRWLPLAGAASLQLLMMFFLMLLWERIINVVGNEDKVSVFSPRSHLYTAYSRSWLARYIPGRIWSFAGRTFLVQRLGIPADYVARSVVIEVAFTYCMITIISGAVLSGVYLHPAAAGVILVFGIIVFAASMIKIGKLSIDHSSQTPTPSAFLKTIQKAARLVAGRSHFTLAFTLKGIALYGIYACTQIAFIVLISLAFADLDFSAIAVIAGAWGVSITVGWISIFPPVGLGARDGLAFVLFSQVIDVPAASSIVVASRTVMLLTDLAFVATVEALVLTAVDNSPIGKSIRLRLANFKK